MFEKIPSFIAKIYPNRVWRIPSEEKKIYLTFDDGPVPEVTPWVLEQLQKFSAKATFFCIGNNIQKYPELFQQVICRGHAVGNHTQDHLNGWKVPVEKYVKNVFLAEENIREKEEREKRKEWTVVSGQKRGKREEIIGISGERREEREKRMEWTVDSGQWTKKRELRKERIEDREMDFSIQNSKSKIQPKTTNKKSQTKNPKQQIANKKQQTSNNKLFRPPYGKLTGKQEKLLRLQGYQIVMWDVLSRDYDAKVSASRCLRYVLENTLPGSIIVFHDSLKAERNLRIVLPQVLQHFSNLGFTFEKLD